MARAPRKAESGYYQVSLNRVWTNLGFDYKPGLVHIVNESLLALMQHEDGLVADVQPSA